MMKKKWTELTLKKRLYESKHIPSEEKHKKC